MHSIARIGIQLLVTSSRQDGLAFKRGAVLLLKQAKAPVLHCVTISCTFIVKTDLYVFLVPFLCHERQVGVIVIDFLF